MPKGNVQVKAEPPDAVPGARGRKGKKSQTEQSPGVMGALKGMLGMGPAVGKPQPSWGMFILCCIIFTSMVHCCPKESRSS